MITQCVAHLRSLPVNWMVLLALCAVSSAQQSTQPEHDRPWTDLFNGHDLSGWISTGDPDAWTVRDGELVTAKSGQGGWLRTEKMYRDFDLTLDFWMPEAGNSGVGLRGSSGGDPAFTGFEVQILDTFGEQPGLRNCGAVYEAVAPATMAVHEPNNWNTYHIVLIGDTLNVWLNDAHIHDDVKLDDRGFYRKPEDTLALNTRATTGYIAFQDYGHAFRYRNIRIKDLSPDPEPDGMIPLVAGTHGQRPDGWFTTGGGGWEIRGGDAGELVGRDGPGHVFTNGTFADFELRALVKANTGGNSGVYFRATPSPDANSLWPIGYEAQIDHHDPKNPTGCIYNAAWAAWPAGITSPSPRDNAWFDYRIRAQGEHIQTWINGTLIVDAMLDEHADGHIALQTHHDGNIIRYKDIRVLRLK